MNEQKKEMESLIGTGDGWYDGQGVFHEFTQESVDAMMDSYKETLESIKKGVLYSKDNGDGDTYSMIPPTEDIVSSYSIDVTKDNGKTVHIGDYSTVEELDKAISDAVKNGQLTQEERNRRSEIITEPFCRSMAKSKNCPVCGKIYKKKNLSNSFSLQCRRCSKTFRYSTAGRKKSIQN